MTDPRIILDMPEDEYRSHPYVANSDLRVVLTMRAANLRTFSGHAAFPGGKADSLDETPCRSPLFFSLLIETRKN